MPTEENPQTALLTQFIGAIVRRKWTVLVCFILFVVIAGGYGFTQPKKYTATADIQLVSQNISPQGYVVPLDATDIATGVQIATSSNVSDIVSKELGYPAPPVKATEVGVTSVVTLSVTSPSATEAAKAANLYANAYIEYTGQRFSSQVNEKLKVLEAQQVSLQAQVDQIESELSAVSPKSSAAAALNVQLQAASSELQTVSTSITNLEVAKQQVATGGFVTTAATVPTSPSSPKPLLDLLVGGLVGLAIGVGIVLTLDFFDDRIRDRDALSAASGGLPLLGEVPFFDHWGEENHYHVISEQRPNSIAAEAYRSLRTSVEFIGFESKGAKIVQITSPDENDGKTTTAMNLAVTIAAGGKKVVLISADLRRPQLHKYFGVENTVGLSTILSGQSTYADVKVSSDQFPNLILIPSGAVPPNPSELLASSKADELLQELREIADVVIVDSPPVLPVTDAVVLAQKADSVVLIANMNHTPGRDVAESVSRLRAVDAKLDGAVLNSVPQISGRYRYAYAYRSSYTYRNSSYYTNDETVTTK